MPCSEHEKPLTCILKGIVKNRYSIVGIKVKPLSDSPCLGKWKKLYFSNTIFVYIFIIPKLKRNEAKGIVVLGKTPHDSLAKILMK